MRREASSEELEKIRYALCNGFSPVSGSFHEIRGNWLR
jgi:hypothetical protein